MSHQNCSSMFHSWSSAPGSAHGFSVCRSWYSILLVAMLFLIVPSRGNGADCMDIADAPLETPFAVSSVNVMFVLDDSGSMDWEVLVESEDLENPDGTVYINGVEKFYLFDEVKEVDDWQNDPDDSLNLYPEQNWGNQYLDGSDRGWWKSQWWAYNKMYYNPSIEYTPWYTTDGSLGDADRDNPRFHPWNATPTVDMGADFYDLGSGSGTIVDDTSNDTKIFTMKTKQNWVLYTSTGTLYGDDMGTKVEGEWAEWYTTILGSDDVDVYAYVNTYWNDSDTMAQYSLYQGGNQIGLISGVNQNNSDNGWIHLGTFSVSAGALTIRVQRTSSSTGITDADAIKILSATGTSLVIPNAHYYVWSGNDTAITSDDQPYLVILNSGIIQYYAVTDDGDDVVEFGELSLVTDPPSDVDLHEEGATAEEDYLKARQNFANWFSYYRKRWYAAVNAIGKSMPYLIGKNVGYRSINSSKSHPALVHVVTKIDGSGGPTMELLNDIYSYALDLDYASTPLRIGLESVGLYYDVNAVTGDLEDELRVSPLSSDPYASCSQNYAIILTDGAWNGGAPLTAGADKDAGPPFADNSPGMLADVAYSYYDRDLAPLIENLVPTNFIDNNSRQHMVTYGVTFGATGHLDPDDYPEEDLYNINVSDRVTPEWPSGSLDFKDKIDDLYHATINGRGKFYSSQNPKELEDILKEVVSIIGSEVGSGASVSINGEELYPESGVRPHMYQAGYVSDGWSGDVMAYEIASTGEVLTGAGEELWFASLVMDTAQANNSDYWDTGRVIATFNGSQGIPFRFDSLTDDQKLLLNADAARASNILNYLRGNHALEQRESGGIFRNRYVKTWDSVSEAMVIDREPTILGDFVHSAPHYVDYGSTSTQDNGVLFVGGNDGMLHAFATKDGSEIFAYVPNQVFSNLYELADPDYAHKYYVDMTPYAKDIGDKTLMVGALGKGGKGIYCLDVTDLSTITGATSNSDAETALSGMVKWEYPVVPGSDDDLGYTFSRPFIVNSNAGWIVILGNGYASVNGNAVFYIMDPETGSVLKKIDTLAGGCNGLSTPLPIDVNNDAKVDYVYAGDLKGNLWKFDLTGKGSDTAATLALWESAYKDSSDNPASLFQALDGDGNVQPITSKPDAMFPCDSSAIGYMVVFGTGSYLADDDFSDTSQQTIYGIWDYGDDSDDSEYLGSFTRNSANRLSNIDSNRFVTLLEQTQIGTATVGDKDLRILSNNIPNWSTVDDLTAGEQPDPEGTSADDYAHAGWYFDLPISKERVVQQVEIRNKIAIVISYTLDSGANTDLCKPERTGTSIVHEMNACTGGRTDEATFDVNDDGVIDENDLVDYIDPEHPDDPPIKVPPTGTGIPGLIFPPKILIADDSEIKYFSTSRRTIADLREVTEKTGMYYWQERD